MGYGIVRIEPWWTPEARVEIIGTFEGGGNCGGGGGWDGPCGGCTRCLHQQEAYYFDTRYALPSYAVKRVGLRWWPILTNAYLNDGALESFPESHELSHWWVMGERYMGC